MSCRWRARFSDHSDYHHPGQCHSEQPQTSLGPVKSEKSPLGTSIHVHDDAPTSSDDSMACLMSRECEQARPVKRLSARCMSSILKSLWPCPCAPSAASAAAARSAAGSRLFPTSAVSTSGTRQGLVRPHRERRAPAGFGCRPYRAPPRRTRVRNRTSRGRMQVLAQSVEQRRARIEHQPVLGSVDAEHDIERSRWRPNALGRRRGHASRHELPSTRTHRSRR